MHLWSFVVAPSVWSVLFASNHNRPHTRVQQQQQQHSTVRRLFWTTTPPAVRRTTFVLASPEEPPAEPPSSSRTTMLLDSNATANGDTTTTTTTKATSRSSSNVSLSSSSSSSQSSVSESTTKEPSTVSADHSHESHQMEEEHNNLNDKRIQENTPPSNTSPYNLSDWLNQIYVDLEQPGLYNRYVTPSLRFSVVTPPTRNGTSTWMDPHSYYKDDTFDKDHDETKPLAVFLPGLDGYGLSAARHQYDDLARTFECWRLVVLPEDRTPFGELVNHICDFVVDLASPSSTTTNAKNHIRPVTLIGESCGGLVAAAVALQLEQRYGGSSSTSTSDDQDKEPQPRGNTNQKKQKNPYLQGLVLVNPATSFDQTNWDALVPLLTALPSSSSQDNNNNNNQNNLTPYSVVGSLILAALIPDSEQRQQILNAMTSLPTVPPRNLQDLQDNWGAMQASFQITEERLPADVLQFRVSEWVDVGDAIVRPRWSLLRPLPTLLVVGEQDALLPSAQEATRLASAEYLPHAETLKVPNRGHFVLDNAVNLTEAILYSQIDPLDWKGEGTITTMASKTSKKKKRYDPIVDWKRPSSEAIETYVQEQVRPLQQAFSPVFFSTDAKGKRWRGLSKLPQMHFAQNGQAGSSTTANRPLLLVGNHQLLAVDLGLLLTELYQQKGWLPRGLAHPVSFTPTSNEFAAELLGRTPGLTGPNRNAGPTAAFQTFGAVQVSPRNYYRLMQTGQPTMLFPGGAREALTGGRSDYPLFWPDKTDFVRTAVKFNATIVPFSAVGMAESARLVLTYEQLQRVPFLANALANATTSPTGDDDDETGSGTSASRRRRMSARMDATNETDLQADLVLPTLPARNYFLFGPAMDTSAIDHKDLDACQTLYDQVQEQVRTGLDDLLEARKDDPFANTPRRVLYEQVWGKQAPTFSVDKLQSNRIQ